MRLNIICEVCEKKIGTATIQVVLSGEEGILQASKEDLKYAREVHEERCKGIAGLLDSTN